MTKKYEVEDRTARKPGTSLAGKWVVWEVRSYPLPHRSYAGGYATEAEARAQVARLSACEPDCAGWDYDGLL